MTISPKIWNFPTFPITKQLFYVPGAAIEGGFTSGGARMTSPEPGGFGMLEVQPALVTSEFAYPLASWLMSKTNGEILRIRLAPTPQIASARTVTAQWNNVQPWGNLQPWSGDLTGTYRLNALRGSTSLSIDLAGIGPVLQAGHVIGHAYDTYMIDEVTYSGTVATISVRPPLRRNVSIGDQVMFRPYFTGSLTGGNNTHTTYDSEMNGNIQLPMLTLSEVIV